MHRHCYIIIIRMSGCDDSNLDKIIKNKKVRRTDVSPGVFSSKNVLLPIFPPIVAIIMRSFKPGVGADSHLIRPCGHRLSATSKTNYRKELS